MYNWQTASRIVVMLTFSIGVETTAFCFSWYTPPAMAARSAHSALRGANPRLTTTLNEYVYGCYFRWEARVVTYLFFKFIFIRMKLDMTCLRWEARAFFDYNNWQCQYYIRQGQHYRQRAE